jgi:hypothetical protein
MKTLAEHLNESICHYEILTAKIVELGELIELVSPDEIMQRCETIRELQETIAEKDVSMHQIMEFIGHKVLEEPMVGEYQRALDLAIQEAGNIEVKALLQKNLLLQGIAEQLMRIQNNTVKTICTPRYNPLLH